MPNRSIPHAGLDFSTEEILVALVSERLDRLADRMIARAHDKLAIFGRLEHADWLHHHIHALDSFPIVAYITPNILHALPDSHRARPVLSINDTSLPTLVDTILISDDLYEEALAAQALRWTPPGTIIYRLYERLPIGRTPLPHHHNHHSTSIITRRISVARQQTHLAAD